MRKLLCFIIALIILIVLVAWWNSRKNENQVKSSSPFKGKLTGSQNAKINVILSGQSKLLSYSIVLKNMKDDIKRVYFRRDGQDIFTASGPRKITQEGDEVVIHGIWQEKSRVPITAVDIEALKAGQMEAVVYFEKESIAPYVVKLVGQ